MAPTNDAKREMRRRIFRIGGLIAAANTGIFLIVLFTMVAPMGSGYAAKIACSEVFVAQRKLPDVLAADLEPYFFMTVAVDESEQVATANLLSFGERQAVYRPGYGCTLAIDATVSDLRTMLPAPDKATPTTVAPWPRGSEIHPDPIDGVDTAALDKAIDAAFEEPNPESLRRTRAVVVTWNGKLIAERYADGMDKDQRLLGWSMTKSVTNALIGAAVHRGLMDKDAPAKVPAWTDERSAITIDQLLRMSSGLSFSETYVPGFDATEMLFESRDTAAVAIDQDLDAPPDTVFSYSSGTTNILSWLLRQELGDDAYWHFPKKALFDPTGMRSAVIETDASGTFVGSSFMYATPQDWARFGLLYLRGGVADWATDEPLRVLPEGWTAYSATPTPPAKQGEYAAQFWANAGAKDNPADRRFPSLPTDLFDASGFQGQHVVIVPSRHAVIVRMGMTHDRGAFPLEQFLSDVLAALPHRDP